MSKQLKIFYYFFAGLSLAFLIFLFFNGTNKVLNIIFFVDVSINLIWAIYLLFIGIRNKKDAGRK